LKKAIYAGTFDPFTLGHEDIVKRALKVFDEIVVLVAVSPSKTPLFNIEDRVDMLKEHFGEEGLNLKSVVVDQWPGLIVDYAKKMGITSIVRGLRPTGDFEIEFQMASMNNHLLPEIDTFFLPTGSAHFYVSSSLVREIFHHGGDITDFVPNRVLKYIERRAKA
jgi:pantetheine-phosphate adenylyltransferase